MFPSALVRVCPDLGSPQRQSGRQGLCHRELERFIWGSMSESGGTEKESQGAFTQESPWQLQVTGALSHWEYSKLSHQRTGRLRHLSTTSCSPLVERLPNNVSSPWPLLAAPALSWGASTEAAKQRDRAAHALWGCWPRTQNCPPPGAEIWCA